MTTYQVTTVASNYNTGPRTVTHTVTAPEQWQAVEQACRSHMAQCSPWGADVALESVTIMETAA